MVLAASGVFGLDSQLFRTRLYVHYLEPASSAGLFEMMLRREQQTRKDEATTWW